MAKNTPRPPKITPVGIFKPNQNAEAAQELPRDVWHLFAKDRESGQLFRRAFVTGIGQKPGTLNLAVLRTESLDGATGLEEVADVPFTESAHLETWGPGARFCCLHLLPEKEKQVARPPEAPTEYRRERERPPAPTPRPPAVLEAEETEDDDDLLPTGVRRGQ